jgi:transcriptional regulator with XRE-family HTH domain
MFSKKIGKFVDIMYNNVYNIVIVMFVGSVSDCEVQFMMIVPNEKLQRARLAKRWSVTVASRQVGVSTNTFNRWERGLQIPQLTTLDQLMEAFAMSAQDLGFGFVISPHKHTESELVHVDEMRDGLFARSPEQEPHSQPDTLAEVEKEQFSRRQMIAALIGAPAAVFCVRQGDALSLLRVEEILTVCASHIPLCWQLYFEGGLAEVERVLPDYITQLSTLTRHPSSYQKKAATLLSQAYQLSSLLGTQHQNYGAAYTSARQGLFYGEMAGDPNLQLASFVRQALVAFYLKRPRQCLQAYQSALQLTPQTSPLLQGRTYIGLAEAHSKLGQEHEAKHFLGLAYTTFPQRAEEDPHYTYTHFSFTSVSTLEGVMHLNLNQPDQAWQAFERIDRAVSREVVPTRLEVTVNQAATACSLGELEQTSQLIRTAVPMAKKLSSQLRVGQAYEVYERMLVKWGDEPSVQELEEVFR